MGASYSSTVHAHQSSILFLKLGFPRFILLNKDVNINIFLARCSQEVHEKYEKVSEMRKPRAFISKTITLWTLGLIQLDNFARELETYPKVFFFFFYLKCIVSNATLLVSI